MLIIDATAVRRLLPMARSIELVAEGLAALERGEAVNPLRWAMRLPAAPGARGGILGMMPGAMESPAVFGLKVISVFPHDPASGHDSHQGLVLLFEPRHGTPVAALDAGSLTAVRTAAASGLATRLLARPEASTLALLGSGVQAATHLEAMRAVRPIRRVRVWSPSAEHRHAFAERQAAPGLEVEAAASAREAVAGAAVICTVTAAHEPVLEGAWLEPGCHVNAVGASIPSARELDTAAVAGSRFFVDSRESALAESGDFLIPRAEGAIGDDHIVAELGELVTAKAAGRRDDDEITVFESLGLAVEDLVTAADVYRRALDEGVGTAVKLA